MRKLQMLPVALLGCCLVAYAPQMRAFNVGDKPELAGKNGKGESVDLKQFSGKIVVVDFWATWCGPCMAEAPHMVEINKKFSSEGLQILGVSLDSDAQAMMAVAKEKGFEWPQIFGGRVWQSPQSVAWGIESIPATYIVGPDGVILWKGHPGGGLDAAIQKAFKEHPPILVDPKVVAEANVALDRVDSALGGSDFPGAMKLLGKVPAGASKDKKVAARLEEAQKNLGKFADGMLAEVDPLIAARQYPAAVSKLKDLAGKLAGTPAGVAARSKLSALAADPEARKQIDAADRAEKAETALNAAEKLQTDKKDALAYSRFKEIVAQFPGTPAAKTASAALAVYEKDLVFVKNVIGSQNETKAKALLGMADSYKNAGKNEQAKKKYQEVIDQYPGTPQATNAKKAIAEMVP